MRISDWSSDVCSSDLLVDEAFGPRRAGAADAPWPNAKIAIALAHGRAANRSLRPTVPETPLKLMENSSIAARDPTDRHAERQAISMAWMTTGEPLLSCHRSVVFPVSSLDEPHFTLFLATLRSEAHTSELQALLRNS